MTPTNRNPHAANHLSGKRAAEATPALGSRHWPSPRVLGVPVPPGGFRYPRDTAKGQARGARGYAPPEAAPSTHEST